MQIINSLQNLTDSKHNLFPNSVRVTDTVSLRSQFIDLHSSPLRYEKTCLQEFSKYNLNKNEGLEGWLQLDFFRKISILLSISRSSKSEHLDNNILFLSFPGIFAFASPNLLIFVLFFVFTKWTEYCS